MKRYVNFSKKIPIFYLIAIPYGIFAFAFVFNGKSANNELEKGKFFQNSKFDNKIILLNNLHLDMYKALYYNPTIHFVPSCGVGWFETSDDTIKDIYIRMQKKQGISEKELYKLIKYVNADFYIHYLRNEEQSLDLKKLEKLGIVAKLIYKNRIIFRVKK